MTSTRLIEARDRLWAEMAEDYGLFPELAPDAALARADTDDAGAMAVAAPRLISLVTDQEATVEEAAIMVERLGETSWSDRQRLLVAEALDAWWHQTLMTPPGEQPAPWTTDTVLGVLVGFGAPMVRWLEPWLAQLDGHGAAHLATVVLNGLDGPAWTGKTDQAGQVLAWARTETVVNGLTLIGGVHLDDDVLSDVLDALI